MKRTNDTLTSCRIQLWFARVPQYPRMISEQALIARTRLPPENPNFPQASLLHAICASASAFTGMVDSMAPMELPFALHRQTTSGYDLGSIADFGLAQAESSQTAIRTADQTCLFAPSEATFEVLQASVSSTPSTIRLTLMTAHSGGLLLSERLRLAESRYVRRTR